MASPSQQYTQDWRHTATSHSSKTFPSCPLTLLKSVITRSPGPPGHSLWSGSLSPQGLDISPNRTPRLPPSPAWESLPPCPLRTWGGASTGPLYSQLLLWTLLPLTLIQCFSILTALQNHLGSFYKLPSPRPQSVASSPKRCWCPQGWVLLGWVTPCAVPSAAAPQTELSHRGAFPLPQLWHHRDSSEQAGCSSLPPPNMKSLSSKIS